MLGIHEGTLVGCDEGVDEGIPVGKFDGKLLGAIDGTDEGALVGAPDGRNEGTALGICEGVEVGEEVGLSIPPTRGKIRCKTTSRQKIQLEGTRYIIMNCIMKNRNEDIRRYCSTSHIPSEPRLMVRLALENSPNRRCLLGAFKGNAMLMFISDPS